MDPSGSPPSSSDPDNDGDIDVPGQPDTDANTVPLGLLGWVYPGFGRPLRGISDHPHRPKSPPGTHEQGARSLSPAQPTIGEALRRDRR